MNANLLPLSLVAAVGLLIAPQTSEAAITYTTYTFDVDSTSPTGSGSFTIVLPDVWPGNIGCTTLIPASSFRAFCVRGDKWTAISVSVNEPLPPRVTTAELSVASKKLASPKILTGGRGIAPVDAVAMLLGLDVPSSPSGVAPSEVSRQRRSRLLETNILLKGGWYRSRPKQGLTSGIFSTDRVVDPATPVLEYSCASFAPTVATRWPRRKGTIAKSTPFRRTLLG